LSAYEKIEGRHYTFEWNYKNRLFKLGKHNFISLTYASDIGQFKIYEVLYDRNKVEIVRRCVFYDFVSVFRIEKMTIIDDERFCYYFKGPKKRFESSIENVLNGLEVLGMVNTSRFFKVD
jgi:hypothetical protein